MKREGILKHLPWMLLGILGASCLGVIALRRGESISALWIIVASVAVYLVAYRYYSLYIATKVMQLDATRATPAVVNNDGLNYVPTNKNVLFGHHFAAIAGAGPLVGPVLAAQVGYLPGTLWLLGGVVLAGRYRTLWCCSSPHAVTVPHWARSSKRKWGQSQAPSRCLAAS
ncbi:Inner membrane protein YjiY [Serratia fonticola]|uniref:Inner membrane protein YjiY n=1 Tax=Serratia fonticola TaxID=47917 RepID=A0A3S5F1C5_SERFO|nr:Inner membrane protein YjiY [Serratia fonticola]